MTSIGSSLLSSNISNSKLLDSASVRKLTPEEVEKFKKLQEQMYTRPVNLQDHISQKPYAEVKVDGKTVATLYNNGSSETSNAMAGVIGNIPSISNPQGSGPELAQQRAEDIAKALGGTIVKSPTAVTQAQYTAAPPIELKTDYAAMEKDRQAAEARSASAGTKVNTQIIAQTPEGETAKTINGVEVQASEGAIKDTSVTDEFMKFSSMSWQEKMRALILKSMGLEEEDLANMSPEEQAKIEAKIEEKIKEEIKKKTGISTEQAAIAS